MSASETAPRVGVSSCLLGANVRFDGGHKHDDFVERLGERVQYVSVCPEVELGLGTPRESLRLVQLRKGGAVSLVAPRSQRDLSGEMRAWVAGRVQALAGESLDGYIVKKDSPSCGMERVRVYDPNGVPSRTGRGLFTEALMAALPLLPVEEEGRLRDPQLRDNFVVRIFTHQAMRTLFDGPWRLADLVAFHARAKMLLLAHAPEAYRRLGGLVAHARDGSRAELAAAYREGLMRALEIVPERGRHANVLQHLAGYFKRQVSAGERSELVELIEDYRLGRVALDVPLTLIRHQVRKHEVRYLAQQLYLRPYPKELVT